MTLHSAKGLEFPMVFLSGWRRASSRTPARSPSPTSSRRSGASPTSASPGRRSGSAPDPRVEPLAVRQDAVQPAEPVPRRDPRRAGRGQGQRHRPQLVRPPEPTAALRLAIGRGAAVPPARPASSSPPTSGAPRHTANGWSRPRSRRQAAGSVGARAHDRAAHRRRRRAPDLRRRCHRRAPRARRRAEATIRFADVGTKHLALAFAPLRKRRKLRRRVLAPAHRPRTVRHRHLATVAAVGQRRRRHRCCAPRSRLPPRHRSAWSRR